MAAALTVMEKTHSNLMEGEREVKGFWPGERGENSRVVSEVRIKIFPVGEGEDLSTTEQISKMNVVIKLLDMVK